MDNKRFGKKIREKRKEHGLTSQQLADLCHINDGYIRQLESGRKIPSMPLLISLCDILKTSPNYLLEYVEDNDDQAILERTCKLMPEQKRTMLYILDAYLSYTETKNDNLD